MSGGLSHCSLQRFHCDISYCHYLWLCSVL